MERQTRPIENGTKPRNITANPAPQANGRTASRVPSGAPRSAVRRPGDAQHKAAPNGRSGAANAPINNNRNGASVPARNQPIRQKTETQCNDLVLGTQPVASENAKYMRKGDYVPTRKSRIKEPMPLATIVFSILCTVLVMFMMINFVKINEYTHDIADMQNELQRLERQEQELTVELEKKNDLTGVDLEALGLVKEDGLKKVEITADNDETVEHFEVKEEEDGVVATVMNALYRNFKEYRNIFFGGE